MKSLFKYLIHRLPLYILLIVVGCLIYSDKLNRMTHWLCFKSNMPGIVLLILAVLSTILVTRAASSKSGNCELVGDIENFKDFILRNTFFEAAIIIVIIVLIIIVFHKTNIVPIHL